VLPLFFEKKREKVGKGCSACYISELYFRGKGERERGRVLFLTFPAKKEGWGG